MGAAKGMSLNARTLDEEADLLARRLQYTYAATARTKTAAAAAPPAMVAILVMFASEETMLIDIICSGEL